jgi:hypothetical protein
MPRVIGAEVLELYIVTTVAVPTAPTSAEITAGDDITSFLTDGGLTTPFDGSLVDVADMSSKFNKTIAGTYGGQPLTMELYRDDNADDAWDALPRGFQGYAAIFRFGCATPGTPAAADVVDLWPIEVITRNPADIVRNEAQRFMVEAGVPEVPLEGYALVS